MSVSCVSRHLWRGICGVASATWKHSTQADANGMSNIINELKLWRRAYCNAVNGVNGTKMDVGCPKAQNGAQNANSEVAPLRTNIGIFGGMNVGKSTLMNMFTGSETSIVDNTPGTTADVKTAFVELHKLGPVKVFDTPGINEGSLLGTKKKEKSVTALKESDLVMIVVDPFDNSAVSSAKELVSLSKQHNKKMLLVYNIFGAKKSQYEASGGNINIKMEEVENEIGWPADDPNHHVYTGDFTNADAVKRLVNFIEDSCSAPTNNVAVLPPLPNDSIVMLNIPMDAETPSGRLLRPQALVQEHLIRNFVGTYCYRMDLKKARSQDKATREQEMKRFVDTVNLLNATHKLKLVVTDSQAMDVVHPWTMDNGKPLVDITTFSIAMINYMSGGRLEEFVKALDSFKSLKKGDKVLICEACNHNRIIDDIGTVQIPNKIKKIYGDGTIGVDHAFGRDYQTKKISDYKLVLHCGGCMIDKQKMGARLNDLAQFGVPITNYGVLLSWFQSEKALERVLLPWNVKWPQNNEQHK